jgi:hypothetical protein
MMMDDDKMASSEDDVDMDDAPAVKPADKDEDDDTSDDV